MSENSKLLISVTWTTKVHFHITPIISHYSIYILPLFKIISSEASCRCWLFFLKRQKHGCPPLRCHTPTLSRWTELRTKTLFDFIVLIRGLKTQILLYNLNFILARIRIELISYNFISFWYHWRLDLLTFKPFLIYFCLLTNCLKCIFQYRNLIKILKFTETDHS